MAALVDRLRLPVLWTVLFALMAQATVACISPSKVESTPPAQGGYTQIHPVSGLSLNPAGEIYATYHPPIEVKRIPDLSQVIASVSIKGIVPEGDCKAPNTTLGNADCSATEFVHAIGASPEGDQRIRDSITIFIHQQEIPILCHSPVSTEVAGCTLLATEINGVKTQRFVAVIGIETEHITRANVVSIINSLRSTLVHEKIHIYIINPNGDRIRVYVDSTGMCIVKDQSGFSTLYFASNVPIVSELYKQRYVNSTDLKPFVIARTPDQKKTLGASTGEFTSVATVSDFLSGEILAIMAEWRMQRSIGMVPSSGYLPYEPTGTPADPFVRAVRTIVDDELLFNQFIKAEFSKQAPKIQAQMIASAASNGTVKDQAAGFLLSDAASRQVTRDMRGRQDGMDFFILGESPEKKCAAK